jgi:hypothetical protein
MRSSASSMSIISSMIKLVNHLGAALGFRTHGTVLLKAHGAQLVFGNHGHTLPLHSLAEKPRPT